MIELPISECLDEILNALKESTPVVVKAPPGAGKTTVVPMGLLDCGLIRGGKCLLVQPRRLAARTAASRIASLVGTKLGERVGYQVRFDNCTRRDTEVIAVTTGILLRRLQSDPLLEGVSCVLLDEFHERSVEMDLALGMLQRIRTSLRPELRIVIMSATLDPAPIVAFLGDACSVISEGRVFPVELRYSESFLRDPIDQQIKQILPEALASSVAAHSLVFLPGVGEIRATHRAIDSLNLGPEFSVLELYGDLPPEKQDAVFAESGLRKIILSTNVAETSVTIDGVATVIDSGLARVQQFNAQIGLPKLQLEPISQASADQRAGRAGRTAPGVCFRLWPAAAHRSRRQRDTPEIERCDLSETLLRLYAWGERDVFEFPWLTPPRETSVYSAQRLLTKLGVIDHNKAVTQVGQKMLTLPIHPRLSRFMLQAHELGVTEDGAIAAAMLSERDPYRDDPIPVTANLGLSDISVRVHRLKQTRGRSAGAKVNSAAIWQIRRSADQIKRMCNDIDIPSSETDAGEEDRLTRALLAAYPDRVARRRTAGSDRGVMVGGRGVRLDARSVARRGELFLCVDVDSMGTEALVRSAAVIDEDWLDAAAIHEIDEPVFDDTRQSVVARRRTFYDDLLLRESPIVCEPSPQVARLLADYAKQDYRRALPKDDREIEQFIQRVRFVSENISAQKLPPLDETALSDLLEHLCQSCTSLAQLQSAPWLSQLRGRYDYEQLQMIEECAPSRIRLPSGNSVSIRYHDEKLPVIEVRIQEIFGWKETPRVAGGSIPIQLHLLGPNHQPQQITDDLANFWKTTYAHVRKELRGRYPKHHWPEDPATAEATGNGLKPRKD